jgi:hypothetical protein
MNLDAHVGSCTNLHGVEYKDLTALWIAAATGDGCSVMPKLIDKGANIDHLAISEIVGLVSPLYVVCKYGNI